MTAAALPVDRGLVRRLPQLVALAVLVGIGAAYLAWDIAAWRMDDLDVYWSAALRARDGGADLYLEEGVAATRAYRYAPWFAYAWVPFTLLPKTVVTVAWSGVLLLATWVCFRRLLPIRTRTELALFVMLAPMLVAISAGGNVHALLLAALAHRLQRTDGPLWIAVAASLKVVPILLVLYLVAERRWRAAAIAVALTAALWLPILLFPVSATTVDPGVASAVIGISPVAFVVVAGSAVALAGWLAWKRSGYTTLATTTAMVLSLPRLFVYDVSWLMLAVTAPVRRGETVSDTMATREVAA